MDRCEWQPEQIAVSELDRRIAEEQRFDAERRERERRVGIECTRLDAEQREIDRRAAERRR